MRPITETEQERIWDMHEAGVPVKRIARIMGRQNCSMRELISRTGGMRPPPRIVNERHLSLGEREEISRGLAAGLSLRLIAQRLRCFGWPRWSLAVSEQVHGTDATLIPQIVHQPPPLARARYAGVYQHHHRTGGARFEIIHLKPLIAV